MPPSESPSVSESPSISESPSVSESPSISESPSASESPSDSESASPSGTATESPSESASPSAPEYSNFPWIEYDYNYGISGTKRAGIGFFYFHTTSFDSDIDTVGDEECYEADFEKAHFWDYISTFWNFLDDTSREMVENLWYGMVIAGGSLAKKASRFLAAVAPTTVEVCQFEDFYDLEVSPLLSRPVFLDPTLKSPKTIIIPTRTILIEPTYDELEPVYNDLIEITANDYYKIRGLGDRSAISPYKIVSSCYVVVQPKNTDIEKKYFLVTDFYSSEEADDRYASAETPRQ